MKLPITVFALLPFLAAVAATPTVNAGASARSASEDLAARVIFPDCFNQMLCSGALNVAATRTAIDPEVALCTARGYGCGDPRLPHTEAGGPPQLAAGKIPDATCAANCVCAVVCPAEDV
ncbi:hypothetical protein DFH09DRAFT_1301758 [Mycena vulgaris]|nr:hypothetical protein DFH09DRAFT_1301758 [Mycena vulgaris]